MYMTWHSIEPTFANGYNDKEIHHYPIFSTEEKAQKYLDDAQLSIGYLLKGTKFGVVGTEVQ